MFANGIEPKSVHPTVLVLGSVGKVLESMLVVGLGQVSLQQLRLHPRKTVRTVL